MFHFSKKNTHLKAENDRLKNELKIFENREEKLTKIEENLARLRKETNDLKDIKTDYSITLEYLKAQEQNYRSTINSLKKEIEELREIKNDEQNNLLNLSEKLNELKKYDETNAGNSFNNSEELRKEIFEEEERKTLLLEEEKELKEKIRLLNKQIDELAKTRQAFDSDMNINKNQFDDSLNSNSELIKTEINYLENKLKSLKELEEITTSDIKKRTEELIQIENQLKDQIKLKRRELDELSARTEKERANDLRDQEDRTISLIIEEQTLIDSLEQKKKKFNEIIAALKLLENEFNEKKNTYLSNVDSLKSKETELELNIAQKQEELNELNALSKESNNLKTLIASLKAEQLRINESIQQLTVAEDLKRESLNELNDLISTNELKLAAMENDIADKKNKLNENSIRLKHANDSLELKHKELLAIVRSIDEKSETFRNLSNETAALEAKVHHLKQEVESFDNLKNEILQKINSEKELTFKLREDYKKLKQIIPLLEKKKTEIKQSNEELESRFANMFKKYSKELNEIGNKKNVLDQIISRKEKDIEEKDQDLFEKIAALEESERVLNLRQTEIESFEGLLSNINEQKEMMMNELKRIDDNTIEKKNLNYEMQIEAELLKNKITEFEKGILNVFNGIEARYHQNSARRSKIENEIKEYEERLNGLNLQIKDSMNELFDLQHSLAQIKIEHEEHRGQISKLASMKKKLNDEIERNQKLLQKYRLVQQKLRSEGLIQVNPATKNEEKTYPEDENFRKFALPELTKVFKL